MESIGEAIKRAQICLDQVDPSAGGYNLNVVVDATVVAPAPPSAPLLTRPILHGVTLVTTRANLANVAGRMARAAMSLPAQAPNPEGFIGLDVFTGTFDVPVQILIR